MNECEWTYEDKTSYWMIRRGCGNDSRREKRGKAEPPKTCPYCKRETRRKDEEVIA